MPNITMYITTENWENFIDEKSKGPLVNRLLNEYYTTHKPMTAEQIEYAEKNTVTTVHRHDAKVKTCKVCGFPLPPDGICKQKHA